MTESSVVLLRLEQWLQQSRPPRGTHLPAQQLADLLAVSRSPVSHALAVLAERGWLRRQPHRGYYVDRLPEPGGDTRSVSAPTGPVDDTLQPLRMCMAVVPAALLEPGYRIEPTVMRRLRQQESRMHALHDAARAQLELDFYVALTEAARNPYFSDAIRRLPQPCGLRSVKDTHWREHVGQRLAVLDLLEHGYNEAASRLMTSHFRSTLSGLAEQSQASRQVEGENKMKLDDKIRAAFLVEGRLRASINVGNPILARRQEQGGAAGVSVDLAREFAKWLQADLELVVFASAGESVDAVAAENADIGFFAIDPKRAEQIAFTPPLTSSSRGPISCGRTRLSWHGRRSISVGRR
ncbi:FCD domain protein [Bordetella holmesii 04P3421]|nr:FCD domain protein [Bordetella holmesii 04P3421]SUV92198.1 extracellular substrate-binding protein [Bordetella holmesii]